MPIRTLILFFIALIIAAISALNWATLTTAAPVSVGFTTVDAPLGLILLGLTVLLSVFFVAYVIYLQSAVLLDTRRHTKEMHAQRELADKAEASRFTDLRKFLEENQKTAASYALESHAALLTRLENLEGKVLARVQEAENVTAAQLGQIEEQMPRRN